MWVQGENEKQQRKASKAGGRSAHSLLFVSGGMCGGRAGSGRPVGTGTPDLAPDRCRATGRRSRGGAGECLHEGKNRRDGGYQVDQLQRLQFQDEEHYQHGSAVGSGIFQFLGERLSGNCPEGRPASLKRSAFGVRDRAVGGNRRQVLESGDDQRGNLRGSVAEGNRQYADVGVHKGICG